jgi:hypothetical protein
MNHTFKIKGNKDIGYRLVDADTFNNWGTITQNGTGFPFRTKDEADDFAWRCHEFKTGQRMTV